MGIVLNDAEVHRRYIIHMTGREERGMLDSSVALKDVQHDMCIFFPTGFQEVMAE